MAKHSKSKRIYRMRRHTRVRARIFGTPQRPRVSVFKSNLHIYAQAIDDVSGKTLAGISDAEIKKITSKITAKNKAASDGKRDISGQKERRGFAIGQTLAESLKKLGITSVVFDRAGFKYHGRVKAVADGLRSGGINV